MNYQRIGQPGKLTLEVSIERLDNGYVVHLSAPPPPLPEPPAGQGIEAKIDSVLEGIPSLIRQVTGAGEGEDWKTPEGMTKARDALKAFLPDLGYAAAPRPFRQEDLVFETKEKLLAWLSLNI